MSWLVFNRTLRKIYLIAGKPEDREVHSVIKSWNAHNNVAAELAAKDGAFQYPAGKWPWNGFNKHEEEGLAPGCFRDTFGCQGVHVFPVPGGNGMGVHAGRSNGEPDVLGPGSKTGGCIRIPANAMKQINLTHSNDPLTWLIVK